MDGLVHNIQPINFGNKEMKCTQISQKKKQEIGAGNLK